MILVTLGTNDKEFPRLLDAIEKCIKSGDIKEEVVVQAGCTKYKSNNMKIFDLIPTDEFNKLIDKCDLLITHGGVGTITAAIKKGKRVIAAARLAKYGEHTNDHQKQIINEFVDEGYIIGLKDFNQLGKTLEIAKQFKPKKFVSNTSKFANMIDDYIQDDYKKRCDKKDSNIFVKLFKKYKEIIMYLIFGVLTTLISLLVYYGLVYTVIDPNNAVMLQVANVISWICSVIFAYFTNRAFVFKSKNKNQIKEVISFTTSRLATLFMDMAIMFIGVTLLHGSDKLVKLISQVVVIVANYIFSKIFVFKKD